MFIKKSTLTLVASSVLLAFTNAYAAGGALGLDNLQEKLNQLAAKAGVKAPNVREELATIVDGGALPDNLKGADGKAAATESKVAGGKAIEAPDEAALAEQLKKQPLIKKIVNIDANQIRAIAKTDGEIMYMIDNGRFALKGKMVDIWNLKPLNTIDEIDYAVHHINLDNMGFDPADFNSVSVGTGKKHVTIFVDPRCTWCHKLMDEIEAKPELKKDYTFDFIIVATLGPDSVRLAQQLYCAKDKDPAKKWEALKAGYKAIEALEQEETCDQTVLRETDIKRYLMGIRGVPFVINHDGTYTRGKPRDLMAFLEGKDQRSAGLQTAPDVIRNAPKLPAPAAAPAAAPQPEVKRVDLTPYDVDHLNVVSVGKGPKTVTVFVDPQCGWCHKLMEEVESDDSIKKDFTFRFVVVGILGPESERLAKAMSCASTKDVAEKWNALRKGKKGIDKLSQKLLCGDDVFKKSQAARTGLGFNGVPFVVAPDGRTAGGKPADLRAFLENRIAAPQPAPAPAGDDDEAETVDLTNYDILGMNLVTVGTGAKVVTVFVDPQCGWCHKLMDEVNADKSIQQDYTFRFIVVGILGPESQRLAKAISCAKTKDNNAKWEALRKGKKGIDKLEAASDCDNTRFNKSQSARTTLNINGVPFLVAPDGRTAGGKPASLRNFLEKKAQPAKAPTAQPKAKPTSVDLKAKGFDVKKLNVVSMGSGKEHVTVFVDPRCSWCHKLMDQVNGNPEFFKKYTFDFVVIGLLGDVSEELAQKLYCADAKPADKWKALVAGKDGIEKLKLKKNCKVGEGAAEAASDEADSMMEKLEIEGVPYVVAPDKRILGGFSPDLMGWLGLGKK